MATSEYGSTPRPTPRLKVEEVSPQRRIKDEQKFSDCNIEPSWWYFGKKEL